MSSSKSVIALVSAIVLAVLLVVCTAPVFLLGFAGILVAIFVRALTELVKRVTSLPDGWSLALALLLITILSAGFGFWLAPSIADQVSQLSHTLPNTVDQLKSRFADQAWARDLGTAHVSLRSLFAKRGDVVSGITGAVSVTLGILGNLVIVGFVSLFLAAQPGVYTKGFLKLVPLSKRARADEILNSLGSTLKWWLVGKSIDIVVVWTLTSLGLWILNVPLPIALGFIAGIFSFIPNLGPLVASLPAILMGLTVSPETALYVALVYFGIQLIESYVMVPLIQQKTVSLPPALLLFAQVLLGVLLGLPGLVLATPLTAVALVLVREVYVKDTLHDLAESPKKASIRGLFGQLERLRGP